MTAHDHRTVVPGCFRCELGEDEAASAEADILTELAAALAPHLSPGVMEWGYPCTHECGHVADKYVGHSRHVAKVALEHLRSAGDLD